MGYGYLERYFGKPPTDMTVNDVEKFISRKIEESLNLDYKAIKNIKNNSDLDKLCNELSKDITAFANSEGGLIILGVEEEKNGEKIYPKEITWGDPSLLQRETLENKLISRIKPSIDGLRIIPIRNDEKGVIFLIDIPQSENPPHMAYDNRYYKRLNFRNNIMEHYEVADLFGRRRKPLLTLRPEIEYIREAEGSEEFKIRFFIANKGKAVAKYVKFIASFPNAEIYSGSSHLVRIDELNNNIPTIHWSDNSEVFHPGVSVDIGHFYFKIKDSTQPIQIAYKLLAEDMPIIYGVIKLTAEELKRMLTQGNKILLNVDEKPIYY